jgi:transcriptional regulator with XRE-family HTH domain
MVGVDPATAIRQARTRASFSQRELARRARTSAAAISFYESGVRDPTFATLTRIVGAAGFETRLSLAPSNRPDREVLARRLAEVLDLAEHLPRRPAARHLAFPPFGR